MYSVPRPDCTPTFAVSIQSKRRKKDRTALIVGIALLLSGGNLSPPQIVSAMEAAGLAIGILGLAGLFKSTLEAWEFVDAYRGYEENFNYSRTRLDNQRAIFLIWAQKLGFFSLEGHNKALEKPAYRAGQIIDTLKHILLLFSNTDQLIEKYGLKVAPLIDVQAGSQTGRRTTSLAIFHTAFTNRVAILRGRRDASTWRLMLAATNRQQKSASVWKKTTWSIRNEQKFADLLSKITALVDDLEKLTRDIKVSQTSEELAAEIVETISEPALLEIEESSRDNATVISSAASTRLRSLDSRTIATATTTARTFATAPTHPSSSSSPRDDGVNSTEAFPEQEQVDGHFDLRVVAVENRQACALLSARVPSPPFLDENFDNYRKARILKEIKDCSGIADPNPWYTISPISESNIDMFLGTIRGPAGTPYDGGIFHIRINLPSGYAFKPPHVWFLTRVLHPSIDARGAICMDILGAGWSPAITREKMLISVASLLDEPNWANPIDGAMSSDWTDDIEECKRRAKEWTQKYATGKIIYSGERQDGYYTVTESA